MFGYGGNIEEESSNEEVENSLKTDALGNSCRITDARNNFIQPVPSQIITVFENDDDTSPVHIDLDSGATLNYCTEQEVLKRGFTMFPNSQLSKLGDGVTNIKAVGEIHETFFRNKCKLTYNAVVCKTLNSPFIGGTLFIKENNIEQDFVRNVIHVGGRQITIQPTDNVSTLPIKPLISAIQVNKQQPSKHLVFKRRTLLPGQTQAIQVNHQDGSVVAVQPHEQNVNSNWPDPQLVTVANGKIFLENNSNDVVHLGSQVKICSITTTTDATEVNDSYYQFNHTPYEVNSSGMENTKLIKHNKEVSMEANVIIDQAHLQFHTVFDKNLEKGYNGFYGEHKCHLNWASSERPPASKVKIPSYDHKLKGLQQEVMDDLTRQNVLLIPQEHGINVQTVCPSFLQRKQRAKNKPKQDLTKNDVRLLVNFGPLNNKIKPVPIHVTKTEDLLIKLGRWKYIIIFDLHNGYFQNHMAPEAIPWLGIQTPFGGLRVMSRSGQGLMGMAEEFDELIAKILKQELKDGICDKIVDDVVIGGTTPKDTAENYKRVLEKLSNANIKIAPEKTNIFPKSADMLGWVWEQGGYLSASPHRQLGIVNAQVEDIKSIRDMRSWIGLFKTLHIVTPNITEILEPFEIETAGKDTKDVFHWTHELEILFKRAKDQVKKQVKLYLPSPSDQLIMETDAAKGSGKQNLPAGIGHVIFALKNNVKLPVRIHSSKLPEKCKRWSPCEIEALAFAAGINKEYDLIRESDHPLIICPDSKPVHEAVNLINGGKFSVSARMSSFLANVNRTPIISKHISGKAKLNPISDLQSRFPAQCHSDHCSIHKFINETIDAVVDPGAKNCTFNNESGFDNREAWKSAQLKNQACIVAKQLLETGKPPPKACGKTAGEFYNDVRQYYREASIANDGLLVVKSQPNLISGNVLRERIVVPKPLVPALLYHMHNHNNSHPSKSQQRLLFQRQFYAIHLDKHLDLLYQNCYSCAIIQKVPKQAIFNETKTDAQGPASHFHADVVKRSKQNILIIKDHFSSLQDAIFINSEKAVDLKDGLISLTAAIRRPSTIYISVDNSPGFKSLMDNKDSDLNKLQIQIIKTDELNKNSNAVIDRGCQELEEELKRLAPEGQQISLATLKLAIKTLNSKLRRRGQISACEIFMSRDQNTGSNLSLNDEQLRVNQLVKRKDKITPESTHAVEVGDTVKVRNCHDKHKANDMYVVTCKRQNNKVGVQKLLHPLSKDKGKIMSKIYETTQKHLVTLHRPSFPRHDDIHTEEKERKEKIRATTIQWKPIDQRFYNDDSSDNEETNLKASFDDIYNFEHLEPQELEWDNAEEHLQLGHSPPSDDQTLENILQPRILFNVDSQSASLTQESSDDNVFFANDHSTSKRSTKLKRQNAMKRKHHCKSEPRMTREMLRKSHEGSISMPTSPSQVELNRT